MEAVTNYDQDDLNKAISCVWKEARGDGHAAMNAVAHVIFNRGGATGFAKTLHEVIYGKNQFSSMSICADREYNLGAPSLTDREYASYVAATNIVKAVGSDEWCAVLRKLEGKHERVVRLSYCERSRESSKARDCRASSALRVGG